MRGPLRAKPEEVFSSNNHWSGVYIIYFKEFIDYIILAEVFVKGLWFEVFEVNVRSWHCVWKFMLN